MPGTAPAPAGRAVAKAPKLANRRPDWELPGLQVDLQLSPHDELERSIQQRATCPQCNKSRSLYCYDCLRPLTACPRLKLPCAVSIVTHHEEARSKNTGVHAALLAPDHVTLHSVDHCPEFDPARAVVLFPSEGATPVAELDFSAVERVFIIDSRWKKAKTLVAEPALAGVRHVALREVRTAFWRFHTAGVADEGVCTIEALLHLFRDLSAAGQLAEEYRAPGYFDDLMWYFAFQHKLVQRKAQERVRQQEQQQQQLPPEPHQQQLQLPPGPQEQQQQQPEHGLQRQQLEQDADGRSAAAAEGAVGGVSVPEAAAEAAGEAPPSKRQRVVDCSTTGPAAPAGGERPADEPAAR